MLDSVPPQAWIALALLVTALAPAAYVWRHFTHGLAPRDITLPPEDLSWKSQRQLAICLAVLAGLIGIGTFVFSEWAEDFARSGWLMPTLFGAIGSYALGTVVPGWRSRKIEPLLRGVSSTYSRTEHPKRYWASLIWNGILGTGLLAASIGTTYNNVTPRCNDEGDRQALIEALATCNSMLSESDIDSEHRADLLGDRGRVHHQLGNDTLALQDYSGALRLDPKDSYALYNRAIIHARMQNLSRAVEDFDASLALRPDNNDAYLERGLVYLTLGRFDQAIKDFTSLHKRDADHPHALANRGIAYAWLGNRNKAEQDFAKIGVNDEAWPVVLHGRAVLAFKDKDYQNAIDFLTLALEIDPEDYFALRMRADAYWETGEENLARDDDDRSMAIDAQQPLKR